MMDAEPYDGPDRRAHGTRRQYQSGCRCSPCKSAEASYRQSLRLQQAKGLPVLGTYISGSEAWARIRVLKQERFHNRDITGWRDRHLPTLTPALRVRLGTLLRLRRVCAARLITDEDLPNHQPYTAIQSDTPVLPTVNEPAHYTRAGYRHDGCGGRLERISDEGHYRCAACAEELDLSA